MIVVDASAALAALLGAASARAELAAQTLHAPHLIDSEVASGLRRMVLQRRLAPADGWSTLESWSRLGVRRYPSVGLLARVWELRAGASAYDATYVALAEALGCSLVTADERLSRAPGLRCAVTVVPN